MSRETYQVWTPDDVLRVQGSNAYQRNWEPLHEKAVEAVQRYYRLNFD